MTTITPEQLIEWCRIPVEELLSHPARRVPLRLCSDTAEMGALMAQTLVDEVRAHNERGEMTHAIVPCGPSAWYRPFTEMVNREGLSLHDLVVFHMDECLDWQGRELPRGHPYNFRSTMEREFYDPVEPRLAVPSYNRVWLNPGNMEEVRERFGTTSIDLTLGGWGQDGHIAYNQARRHPYNQPTLDDLRQSSIRIQENNWDTIVALAQRVLGTAYQFAPPMSVTLGLKECLSARKVRLFADTGAWKQTALRVALFGPPTVEYPITLLQEHPDALITATLETARHPIAEHPEWELLINP